MSFWILGRLCLLQIGRFPCGLEVHMVSPEGVCHLLQHCMNEMDGSEQ